MLIRLSLIWVYQGAAVRGNVFCRRVWINGSKTATIIVMLTLPGKTIQYNADVGAGLMARHEYRM